MHDNVVSITEDVASVEECRLICQESVNCTSITSYGPHDFPFRDTCVAVSACPSLTDCLDCTSEDTTCATCSLALQGTLNHNLVDFLPDLVDESRCREACLADSACTFYTFHLPADPAYPGGCFLLSGLQGPIRDCQHCRTGARNCSDPAGCLLASNDGNISSSGLLITDTHGLTNPRTVQLLPFGTCPAQVTVLAVGGGGSGNSYGGGGGSGQVEFVSLESSKVGKLQVEVGRGGARSYVYNVYDVIEQNNKLVVEAAAGGNAPDGGSGGSGYCGGGGSGSSGGGEGGRDGGDGADGRGTQGPYYPGGKGSGTDVSKVPGSVFVFT